MTNGLGLASLEERAKLGDIDTVVAAFPDHLGRLVGKRFAARFFLDEVVRHGFHACDYLLTVDMEMEPLPGFELASWDKGYGDFHATADLATLRIVPWVPRTALVLCDLFGADGRPVEEAPRSILKRQIERLRNAGFTAMMGAELEFYLFKESYDVARAKNYHGLTPSAAYREDYHVLQTTRDEPVIGAIRAGLEAAGVPIECSKGEWGCGQHEINTRYAPALEMADRVTIYKNAVKEIAGAAGRAATFMAKVDEKEAGSSFHLHASLWDLSARENAFSRDGVESATMRHALAGLMAAARPFALLYAPRVNSFKRYQAASWAPTRVAWAHDNRTCGFRVVGSGASCRIENRLPGADANPYVAMAAAIAAMLDGIERRIEPVAEFRGNAYESGDAVSRVPASLREAVGEFAQCEVAVRAFGERVVNYLVTHARHEQAAFDRAVTCWERVRDFERI
ncbi:MAG: glutamine synthetase [Deltaproteobacteria bacterium]|nr:glutamine synthetase [Deltaproteobacteria bacterium]